MNRLLVACLVTLLVSACTSMNVSPVPLSMQAQMQHLCIENNPTVRVVDILDALQLGFLRHGVETEAYFPNRRPAHCEFILTYATPIRSSQLINIELKIYKGQQLVAAATSTDQTQRSTKAKIDPVISQLFVPTRQR